MARAQIDSRDRQVLEFLAEQRVAVTWHIAELLGTSARAADVRVQALAARGYVHRQQVFQGHPAAVRITRKGLAGIESRLPAPRLDLAGYRHDVGLGWLWLAARSGAFGELTAQVSERTMRSLDRRADRDGPRHGVGIGGSALHYPDLRLETRGGHRIAVELELTSKSRHRLDTIMLAYASDARVDGVLYVCSPGRVATQVADAARRAGISSTVHVRSLEAGSPRGAPDPGAVHAPPSPTRARAPLSR